MSEITERLRAAIADRYVIERELGAGGMATVYLAHDMKHDRKVALKVLKPELAAVLGADRFVQEIKTTANLQHPHILPLFDSGEAGGFLYYVMPFIDGETLRGKLDREQQLGIDQAVRLTTEVADALDYAHRQGVIHRDIKPENILLHDGRPMVADFGIALAVSAAAGGRMTETGLSLGTPHYMSPEQATAEKEITARSDVYSLGCVLYEMLTGDPPHTGASAQQIIMKIVTEEAQPVTKTRKSVPPNVAAATAKALEKLPADRFTSAGAFVDALTNPAYGAVRGGAERAMPVDGRWRARFLGMGVVTALLLVTTLWGWLRSAPPPPAQRSRFYHSADSTHVLGALCCGPLHAITRDGRRFAYLGAVLGRAEIFVRDIDELEARPLPGTRGGTNLFFSPDGEWLGFVDQRRVLHKVALGGGAPIPIVELDAVPFGATWTDLGRIVYASQGSPDLWSVSADGGEPERVLSPDTASGEIGYRLPHFIPEADAVVFTVWMASNSIDDARVGLLHLGSGEVSIVGRGTHPQVTASGHLLVAVPGGGVAAQKFDVGSGRTSGSLDYLADDVFVAAGGGWSDYVVSWSGTLLYRVGGFDPRIDLVWRDGGARTLPLEIDEAGHFDAPRFAPDGRRLAFSASMSGGHRVHVFDLDRGTVLRLTLDGNTEHSSWTDDGDSIVLAKDYARLVIQPSNRSGEEQVITPEAAIGESGAAGSLGRISVAGPWIAFGRETEETRSDIMVVHRDSGATVREYVATPFNEFAPAISPDGRWLAYASDETGHSEVYVSSFPTPGGRQTVSTEGGEEPVWARDGRTLYYRDAAGAVVALSVRADRGVLVVERAETVPLSGYELSPDGADYDVSPTGDGFVMIQSRTSGSRLVVVLNALAGASRP